MSRAPESFRLEPLQAAVEITHVASLQCICRHFDCAVCRHFEPLCIRKSFAHGPAEQKSRAASRDAAAQNDGRCRILSCIHAHHETARTTMNPFGVLLLDKSPAEKLPVPDFRTKDDSSVTGASSAQLHCFETGTPDGCSTLFFLWEEPNAGNSCPRLNRRCARCGSGRWCLLQGFRRLILTCSVSLCTGSVCQRSRAASGHRQNRSICAVRKLAGSALREPINSQLLFMTSDSQPECYSQSTDHNRARRALNLV